MVDWPSCLTLGSRGLRVFFGFSSVVDFSSFSTLGFLCLLGFAGAGALLASVKEALALCAAAFWAADPEAVTTPPAE